MSDDNIPVRSIRIRGEPFIEALEALEMNTTITPFPPSQVDQAEAKLTAFVNEQIEKMRSYVQFQAGAEPSFFEINQALLTYQDTNLGLLALHNTAKMDNTRAKEAFDDWYAEKYVFIRDRENPRTLSAQKWLSQKEIELMIRHEYKDEYHRYNWDVVITEQQLAFMRRLLESWASYQYVLTQLSKNIISELNGTSVDSTMERMANNQ